MKLLHPKIKIKEEFMSYALSPEKTIENIVTLVTSFGYTVDKLAEVSDLKRAYIETLNFLYDDIAPIRSNFHNIENHKYNNKEKKLIIQAFNNGSDLDDFTYDVIEVVKTEFDIGFYTKIKKALAMISDADQQLYESISLLIRNFIPVESTHIIAGSTSSVPGMMFFNTRKIDETLNITDLAELIVHEATHSALFIDELIHGHYNSLKLLVNKNTWTTTPIREIKRPSDKGFHAIIVSRNLIEFRKLAGYLDDNLFHPMTLKLISNCNQTYKEMIGVDKNIGILTSRGRELIEA
jgi:hypothetical protein